MISDWCEPLSWHVALGCCGFGSVQVSMTIVVFCTSGSDSTRLVDERWHLLAFVPFLRA